MEKYRYIIVDDDIHAHLKVNSYFKAHNNYTCVEVFYNPEQALIFLKKNEVDLIFLDMEMPEMNGFQFIEALQKNTFVVILTAFSEKHSHEAHKFYDENLIFYTNKAQLVYYFPKIIARFEKLYAEREIINRINQLSKNEIYTFPKKINNQTLLLADIMIFEVVGHNIVLKMKNKKEYIHRMTFRELKSFLPQDLFIQIRRNIIINIMYVTAFNDTTVCLWENHFLISSRNRAQTITFLKAKKRELYQ